MSRCTRTQKTCSAKPCWLYFIECKGGGVYVGVAADVLARYDKHVNGEGALYTKLNPPVRLLASCEFPSRADAMKAEREMKGLSPVEKRQWAFSYGWDYPLIRQELGRTE